jgi:hypothetical protein
MTGSLSCRVEQLSSAKPAEIYDLLMDVEPLVGLDANGVRGVMRAARKA